MIGMVESENKRRRGWLFYFFVLFCIIVIFAYVLWYFILPFFWSYEKLEILPYSSYYWVANFRGEVKQLIIVFVNNGTKLLTLEEVWIDGVPVALADWGCPYDKILGPGDTTKVYVAPESYLFENGTDYNLTVVTSTKNQFNFTLNVNENNTRPEKVEIKKCDFYYWPPTSYHAFIGIEVKISGDINVIIRKAWINGTFFSVSPQLWLYKSKSTGYIELSFPWKEGSIYNVTIETLAGSTCQFIATAD